MKRILLGVIFTIVLVTGWAQRPDHPFRERPAAERPAEQHTVNAQAVPPAKTFTPPPPAPVRVMAEWEEIQALVITWTSYPAILTQIVAHAVEECHVFIVTNNETATTSQLQAAGVALDNVTFLDLPFNSIWIRDYGPWTVYFNEVDSLAITDFIYNRPARPNDDVIPEAIAEILGLPFFGATSPPNEWVHTGGNNLRDGMGTIFSSELTLGENLYKHEFQIDTIAERYLGAQRYVKYPILLYDGIHHIDMHMRIIDEETIIVGQYPEGVADGPQIEANIDYLKTHYLTPFGNPYHIVRVPMPPDFNGDYPDSGGDYRTYANAIFLNKTILVPTYEEQYDTTALRIYEEQLPGYNVVGIDCNDIITSLGALHCITKVIGVNEPLWIAHPRLRDTYATEAALPVTAGIKHRDGIASATLYYRTAGENDYQSTPMTLADPDNDTWTAAIPAQAAGAEVQYYIRAIANSGKVQVRPLTAPEGYFRFRVKAAAAPPVASFIYQKENVCPGETIRFVDESTGAATRTWLFPGGAPAMSTTVAPEVSYPEPGSYDVTLIAANALGSDTFTLPGAVVVDAGTAPEFEDFLGGPADHWEVDDYNSDEDTWSSFTQPSCYGPAFYVDNYTVDTRNHRDFLRARFDLSGLTEVTLHFDLAYAPYNDEYFDALRVNVIDCSGQKHIVYSKAGVDLATAPATGNTVFSPQSCDNWRHETIDLSAFDGQSITVEFENAGGYGNRLFIDNIDLSSPDQVNLAPFITLTTTAPDTIFTDSAPVTIPLNTSSGDVDGLVTAVDFYANGAFIGADDPPFFFLNHEAGFGAFTFEAVATDNDGAIATSNAITVTVLDTTTTSVREVSSPLDLRVFPNPTTGRLWLQYHSPGAAPFELHLVDLLGRTVHMARWRDGAGEQQRSLDLGDLPGGVYQLILRYEDQRAVQRVMRSR